MCPRWGNGLCDVAAEAVNTQESNFYIDSPLELLVEYPEGLHR